MLNWIESVLARWTGRSAWPYVDALFDEQFSMPGAESALQDPLARDHDVYDIFTYSVAGATYDAAAHEIAGYGANAQKVGHHIRIQYNPRHPKRIYYEPSCQLAGRLVGIVAVLAALGAIGISVYVHTR